MKVWVMGSLLAVGGVVFGFILKAAVMEVLVTLREIKEALSGLNNTSSLQQLQIKMMAENISQINNRLDRHSKKIVDLEKKELIHKKL